MIKFLSKPEIISVVMPLIRPIIINAGITLEKKVEQRTGQYKKANQELTAAMHQLKMTQSQLVHNANMPILGDYID